MLLLRTTLHGHFQHISTAHFAKPPVHIPVADLVPQHPSATRQALCQCSAPQCELPSRRPKLFLIMQWFGRSGHAVATSKLCLCHPMPYTSRWENIEHPSKIPQVLLSGAKHPASMCKSLWQSKKVNQKLRPRRGKHREQIVRMLRAMLRNSKAVQTAVAMPPRRAKKMGQLNMRLACGYLSTLELKNLS